MLMIKINVKFDQIKPRNFILTVPIRSHIYLMYLAITVLAYHIQLYVVIRKSVQI